MVAAYAHHVKDLALVQACKDKTQKRLDACTRAAPRIYVKNVVLVSEGWQTSLRSLMSPCQRDRETVALGQPLMSIKEVRNCVVRLQVALDRTQHIVPIRDVLIEKEGYLQKIDSYSMG